ncbi:hypothetical protein FE257_001466 [Aspergillus nanangensis]|uniref:Uncharacterized protein n=1 Tax=Aspergillus nanangensis TaxID=2582783 RepID=A0AAD4CF74_ASPNN|nr:hypothetical protein FE257_001466 [Aspergillus nanangensis]
MSLNTVTSGVAGRPPKLRAGTLTSTVSGTADTATKQVQGVSDSALPGVFPGDEDDISDAKRDKKNDGPILSPISQWFSEYIPSLLDKFESKLMWLLSWLLPAPRQAKLYEAAAARPASTTFILCQLICCGVPLLVFFAGVFLFAAVAILLWLVLSLLILGPVLLVASVMGVSLWGWGWLFYGLVQWVDQKYFGGRLSWFWFSRLGSSDESDEKDDQKGEPESN